MIRITRNWRVAVGGVALGSAAVIGFAGASASAEPVLPNPPVPVPATVTQTVTVVPDAAAQATPGTPALAPTPVPATAAPLATAPVAPAPTLVPATSGTIAEFLKEKGVAMEPQKAAGFTALNIVLPMPLGWSVVPDPNVPDAFLVIADRQGGDGLYTSNAQLVVYKLVGEFDPKEAITHGYLDTQELFNWQTTDASLGDYGGFPSSAIEGTYRENDMTLNTSRRHVIAPSGPDHYLVSLSVTTAANQVVATADAIEAIVKGFRVTSPTAVNPAAAATPANPLTAPTAAGPAAAPVPAPVAQAR